MSAPPLTHHEIIELAGPYARQGLRVDLPASDRLGRRLRFRRVDHASDVAALAGLHETLQLESFGTGTCRLTRTLATASGLQATLQVLGPDSARLLELVRTVDPLRQFRCGPGYAIALSYEVYPAVPAAAAASAAAQAGGALAVVLTRGVVRLDMGVMLALSLSAVRGVAADRTLTTALAPGTGSTPGASPVPARGDGAPLELPEDLLAVLGWDWTRLIVNREGWKSKLRLRGGKAKRTRNAELALERAAVHLVQTFGASPAAYHERWRAARWGVFFRRALPVLMVLAVLAAAMLLPRAPIQERPGLVTLIFHIPIALIALSFSLQELSQFEIPPVPRRLGAMRWRAATLEP